jgi:hypothetical protein
MSEEARCAKGGLCRSTSNHWSAVVREGFMEEVILEAGLLKKKTRAEQGRDEVQKEEG